MTRKSLAGPIFLIVLGVVFLYRNFHPNFSLPALLADTWPWILIAWGGLRLAELGAAAWMRRPAPAAFGATTFLVAALICLLGSAIHALEHGDAYFIEWGNRFRCSLSEDLSGDARELRWPHTAELPLRFRSFQYLGHSIRPDS